MLLGELLASGADLMPDPKRPGFYEVEDGGRVYYFNVRDPPEKYCCWRRGRASTLWKSERWRSAERRRNKRFITVPIGKRMYHRCGGRSCGFAFARSRAVDVTITAGVNIRDSGHIGGLEFRWRGHGVCEAAMLGMPSGYMAMSTGLKSRSSRVFFFNLYTAGPWLDCA